MFSTYPPCFTCGTVRKSEPGGFAARLAHTSDRPLPPLAAGLHAVTPVAQRLPIGQVVPLATLRDRHHVIGVGLLVAIRYPAAALACPGVSC